MSEDNIPKSTFFPSLIHFGTDFVKNTPLISLNLKEFHQLNEKDETVVQTANLVQDKEFSTEVYKVLKSKDSKLAQTVMDLIESTDVSYLQFNTITASLKRNEFSKVPTSGLLNTMIKEHNFKVQELQVESLSNPTDVLISTQKKTPIRSRKKKSKKSTDTSSSFTSSQNLSSSQNLTSSQNENKPKKAFTKKIDENIEELEKLQSAISELFIWYDFKKEEKEIPENLLKDLDCEIKLATKNNYVNNCTIEDLTKLLNILSEESKKLEEMNEMEELNNNFKNSIQATILSLHILTSKDLSKELLISEIVENSVEVAKLLFRKWLFPMVELTSQEKKKQDSKLSEIIHYSYQLLSLFYTLISNVPLKEEVTVVIADLSLSSIFIENLENIQVFCIDILSLIFSKYKSQRDYLLSEIIASVLKISTKAHRGFKLENGKSVHIFTSLMVQLIQSCVELPVQNTSENVIDEEIGEFEIKAKTNSQEEVLSFFEQSFNCSKIFSDLFLKRCITVGPDGDNKQILVNFVDDLLEMLNLPNYPAADLVLNTLANTMCTTFLNDKTQPDKYRALTLDVLGKIGGLSRKDPPKPNFDSLFDDLNDSSDESEEQQKFENPNFQDLQRELSKSHKLENLDVAKISVFMYLSAKVKTSVKAFYSRQFCLSQWLSEDLENPKKVSLYLELWNKQPEEFDTKISKEYRSEIEGKFKYLTYYRTKSLINQFETILKHILNVLKDNKVVVRSRAIKSLQTIIEEDHSILETTGIQLAIQERALDESIKVRENVIELVGEIILKNSKYIPSYLQLVIQRVKDTGLSVRKRSIHILGDLLLDGNLDDAQITDILVSLSTRLTSLSEDSELIKELVYKVFENLWFSKKSEGDGLQIIDVLSQKHINFKEIRNHWFTKLLIKIQSQKTNLTKKVNTIIEQIIKIDGEGEKETMFGRNSLSSCFSVLHLFCFADPKLLVSKFQSLSIYFNKNYLEKEEQKVDVIFHIAAIFNMIIPIMNKPSSEFEINFFKNLISLIFEASLSNDAFLNCIKCLCSFSIKTGSFSFLCRSFNFCYSKLSQDLKVKVESNSLVQKEMELCARLISTIGLLCRCFNFDDDTNTKLELPSGLNKGIVTETIYKLSLFWYKNGTEMIKARSLNALGNIFIRSPLLLVKDISKSIINQSLDEKAPISNKKQAIQLFKEFLIEEEVKFEQAKEKQTDTGVSSSILPAYINKILELICSSRSDVRFEAIEVVELSLRRGLVFPPTCIPYVIAAQVDSELYIRDVAQKLCGYLESRHHTFLFQKSAEGIIFSFQFLKRIGAKSMIIDQVSIFSTFYFGVFKNFTPSERNIVLDGILKEIESNKKNDLELIQYLIECLVFLPFSSQVEVLHCLHKINKFIDYEGDSIYTEFESIMEEETEIKENDLILQSSSKLIFILEMKRYLENAFCITKSKLEEYDPSAISKMKNDKTIFRPIKPVFSFIKIKELLKKNDSTSIWSLLDELYSSHQESGSTTLVSSKKRKRETPDNKRKKAKPTPKKKRKGKKKRNDYESDEEDSYEEYESDSAYED
eukprot:gene10260-2679_t